MIHETVPKSPIEKQHDIRDIKIGLLTHLKFGKENAIKSHDIARAIGVKVSGTNQQIRKACKELLVERKIPIISCTKGFYKAKEKNELREYFLSLEARKKGIERDQKAIKLIMDEY